MASTARAKPLIDGAIVTGADLVLPSVPQEIKNQIDQEIVSDSKKENGVLRVTNSAAQYDVSKDNPQALANLAKAIAGAIHKPEHVFHDTEFKIEREIGEVMAGPTLDDIKEKGEFVLKHRDSVGKSTLGRVLQSAKYINENPLTTICMKIGWVADPEEVYKTKIIQMLATLDQEGMFGPPGASTLNLDDWKFDTRIAWRDIVISRNDPKPEVELKDVSFSEVFRSAARLNIL